MKNQLWAISLSAALLAFTSSVSALAQNIDTESDAPASGVFTATGIDENGDSGFAEATMKGKADRICGYGAGARQVSATRFRTVYTYLRASAEFECRRSSENDTSGLHRRCWYFDDSNPDCFRK